MMRIFRLTLLAVLALIASSCNQNPLAPAVRVESLASSGHFIDLSKMQGKVVMLDFWATWCGPCREAMPEIHDIGDKYKSQGLEVMGITTEDRAVVVKFFRNKVLPYPVFLDGDESVNRAFNIHSYPSTVLLDRNGSVVFSGHFKDDGFLPALTAALKKT